MTRKPWDEAAARAMIDAHVGREGAGLPILHALQEGFGHVPAEAVPLVAHALNLSRAEVHGLISFYHDFRREPAGRTVVRLCRAEACQSMGAARLAEHAQARLGIGWHETTPDGHVTLEPVFCLGLCAAAPAAMIDAMPTARLTETKLDAILEAVR
jgi:formate dehydrogenase subunit gamma